MIHIGNNGYLKIIVGPMFSGKTSELITISRLYKRCEISVCIINYSGDTRYGHSNILTTHDNIMIPCISLDSLETILSSESFLKNKVILINEAQFFEDLYIVVKKLVEDHNKIVYICGLDGDYRRESFGDILKLIPLCDEITKKHAICNFCKNGNRGIFTKRLTNETKQKMIGYENYESVCRKCFKKKQFKSINKKNINE